MSAAAPGHPSQSPIPFRGLAAFTLYVANLMVTLDMTVANVAVPHIAGNLGATLEQGTWVVTSYAVAEAITVPLTGWLAGRFGAVRLMLTCMAGFTFFSLMCGLSVTLPMLVLFRVGQGLSGGPIMSLVQTLMGRLYTGPDLARAYAVWTLTVLMGPAMGPIIGGMISDNWSWHWVFFINLPIGVACSVVAYVLLRPAETPLVRQPIDRIGLALLVVWVGALQIMLDTGRDRDWFADPTIVILAATAAIGFCAFAIWEFTDDHPAVDLRLLRKRPYAMCVTGAAIAFSTHFSSLVVVPQWLQATMGYSAEQAGMVMAISAVGSILATQISIRLLVRMDPRIIATAGAIWGGTVILLRTRWNTELDFTHFAWIFGMQGFGIGMLAVSLNSMLMSSLSVEETASGIGLLNFIRTMSAAAVTASMLTFWSGRQAASRIDMVGSVDYGRTTDVFAKAGVGAGAGTQIISGMIDRQANTIAVLQTFYLAGVVMLVCAAAIWTLPRIELNRFKSGK